MKSKDIKPIRTAVVYIRTTDSGTDQSLQIKTQLKAAHIFAKDNNIKIVKIFKEHNTRNMEYYEMGNVFYDAATFCIKHSVDCFLTHLYDTFAEYVKDYWHRKILLEDNGVSILCTGDTKYQLDINDAALLDEARHYKEAIIKKMTLNSVSKKDTNKKKKLPKK